MPSDPVLPVLSVVVPCFNEAEGLPRFHERLDAVMTAIGLAWEVVYVNDGSRDRTLSVIGGLRAGPGSATGTGTKAGTVACLNLSRNFGKEIALTAGLDHARGSGACIVIDADLQDPPEVIADLVDAWRDGVDMAYAQRRARQGDSWLKRLTAKAFYRLMRRIGDRVVMPPDTGDFRLISRRAVDTLLALRERHRFMKGLFAWIGYPARAVLYDRDPRVGGRSSFSYWSLWNFALEGITSFTVVPLRVATYIGLLVALFSIVYGGFLVVRTLAFGNPVPGYPSLMAVITFLGGAQLTTLGVIGEYLGRIFNETKQRPLYVVERFEPATRPATV